MPNFIYANNVSTTLAGAVSASATTITLSSMTNAPTSIPPGYYWEITLNDEATQGIFEILYAMAYLGGGQFQVLRGQEQTAAVSWLTGDYAFGAVTAGMLGQFVQGGQLGGYVQLSPGSAQSGFIDVSGDITGGGTLYGLAVQATNGVSGASGSFTGSVAIGNQFSSNVAYSNRAISALPIQLVGSANSVGIGPSSGLSAQGITGSTLAIAQLSSAKVFAFDVNGNLGIMGGFFGTNATLTGTLTAVSGTFSGTLAGPTIKQGGVQVIDSILCNDGTIDVAISDGVATLSNAGGGSSTVAPGFAYATSANAQGVSGDEGAPVVFSLPAVSGGGQWMICVNAAGWAADGDRIVVTLIDVSTGTTINSTSGTTGSANWLPYLTSGYGAGAHAFSAYVTGASNGIADIQIVAVAFAA